VKTSCTGARRAVLSAIAGRLFDGKSITKSDTVVVDGPNNAKPPHLAGACLQLRDTIRSGADNPNLIVTLLRLQAKFQRERFVPRTGGETTWKLILSQ
jgi:hypothetical protein